VRTPAPDCITTWGSTTSSASETTLPAKRWPAGHREHHPVAEERLELERAVAAAGAHNPELELTVEHPVDDRPGRIDAQGHLDMRVRGPETAQELRQHVLAGAGRGADDEVPRGLVAVLRQLPGQLIAQREHAQRVAVQHLAAVGRRRPPAGAVDQRRAHHPLERLDLLADRGLRHPQGVGRGRERPPLRRPRRTSAAGAGPYHSKLINDPRSYKEE